MAPIGILPCWSKIRPAGAILKLEHLTVQSLTVLASVIGLCAFGTVLRIPAAHITTKSLSLSSVEQLVVLILQVLALRSLGTQATEPRRMLLTTQQLRVGKIINMSAASSDMTLV
jgi:hypothetical protein